ncbi:hypothetical protein B0H14DRAFT_2654038 [Mycena olivaceomarginata]|nr:hypothetical protein B0H14DRAFT_2654038 [Mycena olivaceomarginata]
MCGVPVATWFPPPPGAMQTYGTVSCGSSIAASSPKDGTAGSGPLRPSAAINAHTEIAMHRVQILRDRLKLPAAGMSKVRTTKTPKQINSDLGSSSKKWAISMYMTGISSLPSSQAINIEWLRNNTIPIDDDEVSIRWFNNRVLDADTATMTLGDFYAYYSTPSNAPMYLQNVPPMWRHFLKQKSSPFILP